MASDLSRHSETVAGEIFYSSRGVLGLLLWQELFLPLSLEALECQRVIPPCGEVLAHVRLKSYLWHVLTLILA